MKLAIVWLIAAVTAALVIGSCSIQHRSGDFACETSADCAFGRICSDHVCVSTLPPDAGTDAPSRDAGQVCPSQCSTCDVGSHTCLIDCGSSPDKICDSRLVCPAGWNCKINCNGQNACSSGVDCSEAASCDLTCLGRNSCKQVDCGTGKCNLDCIGIDSCRDIDCLSACACDVFCGDQSLCAQVTCKDIRCFDAVNDGCSSTDDADCNTCK